MQDSLSKAMTDFETLMDLYGKDAILNALADIADVDENEDILSEGAGRGTTGQIAKAIFDILVKSSGATGRVIGKGASGAIGKALDQDVHISSQGPVLKVTDPELYNLVSQTNALVQKTNDLIALSHKAIEGSTKELKGIDNDFDDFIAGLTPGTSVSDVKVRQAAGISPGTTPDEGEDVEEPEEKQV